VDHKPKTTDDVRSGIEYHYVGAYESGDAVVTTRDLNVRKDAMFEDNYIYSIIKHGTRGTIIRMVSSGIAGASFSGYEIKFNDGFTGVFIPEYYLEKE
jgi:hypothetical protein